METLYKFQPEHQDLVHDVAFDFYGQRLATCSSDQQLKVWDMRGETARQQDDNENEELDANGNAARMVPDAEPSSPWVLNDAWKAHDASILKVAWAHPEFGQVLASCSFDRSIRIWEEQEFESRGSGKRWAEKARLVDSRGTVQDIEFAPNHLGLKLATVSVDGILRIYEAMDVINLAHWTLMEDFEVSSSTREKDTEFCLSWCPARSLPPLLVAGCGKENTARMYRYEEATRMWLVAGELTGHGDRVHDVAWAPSMGKSYQWIATACKDKHVRIFKVTPVAEEGAPLRVELVADLVHHESEVWRVEWNVTGTVLASSGEDGRVLLWKENYLGEWTCMSSVQSWNAPPSSSANNAVELR